MRIIRWVCVAVALWSMWRIRNAATTAEQYRGSVEMDCARQEDINTATSRRSQGANVVSIVSLVVAVASALFTYYQVELTRDQVAVARDALELTREQADAARDTLQQAITIDDLGFIGKLSVTLDEADGSIEIANFSDFPLTDSLVWTLGIAEEVGSDTRLDTVRAPLAGLGACKTMTVSIQELRYSVAPDTAKHTREEDEETLTPAVIEEAFLTVRAPSGDWYTISENISYERVEGNPDNADQAASQTPADQILGDTVAEGVNRSVYFKPDFPIGPRTPVSDGAYAVGNAVVASNGCNGPNL